MTEPTNKIMKTAEAIEKFVHDGDELIIGNYTVGICMDLVFEVARQRSKAE